MHLQESGEMYLETILRLSKERKEVRSIDVSEYMGFSKPSISRAIGLLKQGGYVNMDEDGFLTLTDAGKEVANKIYERHQVLTAGGQPGDRSFRRLQDRTRHQRRDLPCH